MGDRRGSASPPSAGPDHGTFEAALFKWVYDGKVGPAKIKGDQYWFFAEGVGPIARVDKKDISAMLVYRDKSKVAAVLVSRGP